MISKYLTSSAVRQPSSSRNLKPTFTRNIYNCAGAAALVCHRVTNVCRLGKRPRIRPGQESSRLSSPTRSTTVAAAVLPASMSANALLANQLDLVVARIPPEANSALFDYEELSLERAGLIVREQHPLAVWSFVRSPRRLIVPGCCNTGARSCDEAWKPCCGGIALPRQSESSRVRRFWRRWYFYRPRTRSPRWPSL